MIDNGIVYWNIASRKQLYVIQNLNNNSQGLKEQEVLELFQKSRLIRGSMLWNNELMKLTREPNVVGIPMFSENFEINLNNGTSSSISQTLSIDDPQDPFRVVLVKENGVYAFKHGRLPSQPNLIRGSVVVLPERGQGYSLDNIIVAAYALTDLTAKTIEVLPDDLDTCSDIGPKDHYKRNVTIFVYDCPIIDM